MDNKMISGILEKIRNVKIAVYGDFCLDAYWLMDPSGSEISVETGIQAEAVSRHYYSPGGASNVVANLAALNPAEIRVIGVTGNDIFGRELRLKLQRLTVDMSSLFIQQDHFDTYTFVKKYIGEGEQPRMDFGLHNVRSVETDELILEKIKRALETSDVIIINQQVPGSITRPQFIEQLNEIFEHYQSKLILLDSRHYSRQFRHVYLKANFVEIAGRYGAPADPEEYIPLVKIQEIGTRIFQEWRKPVFVTCGERGIMTFDDAGMHYTPGLQILKKLDPVGAGDTMLSALALCLGAGYPPGIAAEFANLAAAVTIQKLFTTGTASPEEILEISMDPDYHYNPDLAETPGKAGYIPGTKIEICEKNILDNKYPLKHVVFDHDGTLSTLRAGWEKVMEDFMIRVISGGVEKMEGDKMPGKVRERVKEYIALSAGVRTIIQMKALADLVEEFNVVPEPERLDAYEYKKLYLLDLMKIVNRRLEKMERGEMGRDQFIIPGTMDFLESLKKLGVIMYLASGTDEPDVRKEAGILGYAQYFGNQIYGSREDMQSFSKKILMARIVQENNLRGNELMVVGDGPVEIRECRKRGGLSLGMATHEDGTGGANMEKRRRLIRGGAHLILPDFREVDNLLRMVIK
ncbi:MAG: HAD family hydrolase [Cyclobacteriaceae bacterium]|nr:HAD family hydrolase [Cyclobacteriaceae bacterium]